MAVPVPFHISNKPFLVKMVNGYLRLVLEIHLQNIMIPLALKMFNSTNLFTMMTPVMKACHLVILALIQSVLLLILSILKLIHHLALLANPFKKLINLNLCHLINDKCYKSNLCSPGFSSLIGV